MDQTFINYLMPECHFRHTFLKEYRRTRKGMKDKRNRHGAVGKSSSEQHLNRLPYLRLQVDYLDSSHNQDDP